MGIQVPRQFRGVVQYATDHEQDGIKAVNSEVARPADYLGTCTRVIAAQSQMPRSNTHAEFGSRETARSVGLGCHVAKRRDDQALVAQPSGLAELLVRPGKDVDDIVLCGLRQPVAKHRLDVLPNLAAAHLPNKALKLFVGNVCVPSRGDIRPALAGRLPQGLELCLLHALAFFDEAQSFPQDLAGVLVATGLHQGLYQLLLMFAENYVACRHVFGSEGARTGSLA
jgi:hypothetical protein